MPPGVSVDKNMSEAAAHWNPTWFYGQVRNKGPWDYKQRGSTYQDFGNFNYGATGAAMGFPDQVLDRMAGLAQKQAGTSKPDWSGPLGKAPYGDDPDDQLQINRGIEYARCKCKGH
jgi:hypothetical protein